MQNIIHSIDNSSWVLLTSIFIGLSLAAFLGKFTWKRRFKQDQGIEEEIKIVLGAALSLFGLLIGFILSIAISGYNSRLSAEENEAIAIGNAFQRTALLQESHQTQAKQFLNEYLQLRISFFKTMDDQKRAEIRIESIRMQTQMWALISQIAKAHPDSVITTALNACNELYVTQQKTMASWRHQIPSAAWAILIVFGVCSNFLIGYNIRGNSRRSPLIFVIPAVTALALFMIAEIDVPGKGIIHVSPVNLEAIDVTIAHGGLLPER